MKNSRTYVTVDIQAVKENFRQMEANLQPGTKMIAVVKADALWPRSSSYCQGDTGE